MATDYTENYNLGMPEDGDSNSGAVVNGNFETIDGIMAKFDNVIMYENRVVCYENKIVYYL